jgi:poly-gamma-glutamate synthesis protein (capsule biosynthesis protein)
MTLIALAGDVMLGRGIDQILAHPGDPTLRERYATSALDYVALAERAGGPIPRKVPPSYVWGEAREALGMAYVRIVNLETSVTVSDHFAPKGIHYRMHPANVAALAAAGIACVTLANNHVLDFGRDGLIETLGVLATAGIAAAGAGGHDAAAAAPAVLPLRGGGRVIVVAFGMPSSGIPQDWAARPDRPGVHLVAAPDAAGLERIAALLAAVRAPGDVAVASMHWGPNWGYDVPRAMRAFAHGLIERAGFHLVHGHSSHHPMGLALHGGGAIIYGAGDFLNDYEGIGGYEAYRPELAVLYLAEVDAAQGRLVALRLAPFRISRFSLNPAAPEACAWLAARLSRESARFGTEIVSLPGGMLAAQPAAKRPGEPCP